MSLLSIVASSSAFRLPASPPPKGSSIDSDWSTKNKKQPGFLRLISAWYAMVFLHFFWHHEKLRLSHARGHRLESCRDHPQNAATPGPADRVSRLTLRPSQAASIPAIPPCPLSP